MQLFLPESGPGPFICQNQPCLQSKASLAPEQLSSPLKQLQPKSSRTSILGQKHPTKKMCFHQKAPWVPKDTDHCQLSPEHRDWEAFRDTQSVLMKTNTSPRWQLGVSPRKRLRSKSCTWQRRERWGPCWSSWGGGPGEKEGIAVLRRCLQGLRICREKAVFWAQVSRYKRFVSAFWESAV